MQVAVVYEASYVLYGQHYDRPLHDVIVQHQNEPDNEFQRRVQEFVDSLDSRYSYYDWEIFNYCPE